MIDPEDCWKYVWMMPRLGPRLRNHALSAYNRVYLDCDRYFRWTYENDGGDTVASVDPEQFLWRAWIGFQVFVIALGLLSAAVILYMLAGR